uniref:ATP synthase subunit a n=1 Tax=Camaena cicatricosa TaxID=1550735 RepID=A0A0A0QRU6_CAMCI|nr:ATP synthase F0 subunit 6 [Camaena cicatricosa]AIS20797.1 ATP synthase subunit 6 [Camaena cicatricosa]
MTDLFSSLDGANTIYMWGFPLMLVSLLLTQPELWGRQMSPTNKNIIFLIWFSKANNRFNLYPMLLMVMFAFLLTNNLMGLTPISYSLTSSLMSMFSLALLSWLFLISSGYTYSPMKSLAHLAPQGAPMVLMPFLVVIEVISLLIRPLTLTVRLIANISAGHIVLGLIANTMTSLLHHPLLFLTLLCSVGYTLFEIFVSVIQAYIFTLLISLYATEHP